MSERKLFTPDEVNRLIPRLTELMETAIERHGQALALQERLRDDRARVSASGGEPRDTMDWKARAERLDGLGIEVRQVLQDVQAMGGVVKDLETGLVDFPGPRARRAGRAGRESLLEARGGRGAVLARDGRGLRPAETAPMIGEAQPKASRADT